MDDLKEKIAIAVYRAQSDLVIDMAGYERIMFDVAAAAALRVIDEEGFAIVPKAAGFDLDDAMKTIEADLTTVEVFRNLEEPRGWHERDGLTNP